MAKGITQDQVNGVADELLNAGERPTIERIRAALGTGSPNTVNRMLDLWWLALGQRLNQAKIKATLPDAPAEVSALAAQFWEQAVASAQSDASRLFEQERLVLTADRNAFVFERAQLNEHLERLRSEQETATLDRNNALGRVSDLQNLVDLQRAQMDDLVAQRENILSEVVRTKEQLASAQSAHKEQEMTWSEQRRAMEVSHTAMHDRWLAEVDRARQEEAKTASKLKNAEQNASAAAVKSADQIGQITAQLRSSEREDVKKTARIGALEEEVLRLHNQLKSRINTAKKPAKPSRKKPAAST